MGNSSVGIKLLAGQTAVVTGASSGIGAGIARLLGDAGANVIVNYSGNRQGPMRWCVASKTPAARLLPSGPT